jgi:hypothetical protein
MGCAHPEDLQVFISMETPKHLPPKEQGSDDAESGQVLAERRRTRRVAIGPSPGSWRTLTFTRLEVPVR